MSDPALQFEDQDFDGALPPEGYYAAVIERARFHTSRSGNTTLQVVCEIGGVDDRVADYFVLSGASERGRAVSRRRLIELYHACGFSPKSGDPIRPEIRYRDHSRFRALGKISNQVRTPIAISCHTDADQLPSRCEDELRYDELPAEARNRAMPMWKMPDDSPELTCSLGVFAKAR